MESSGERQKQEIIAEYKAYIKNREFACIAAKAALEKEHISCLVIDHMACPKDDHSILQFLYSFVDSYRASDEFYHSAIVIFREPEMHSEEIFDQLMWQRLQALAALDSANYAYDKRVDSDPKSVNFSFSLKEEACYIIGLHPNSSRLTRRFSYPALVFNPHAQFEKLRVTNKYEKIKGAIRKRDMAYSGSTNPMLDDFGKTPEVFQYSGRNYDESWKCPLEIKHATTTNNSAA
jgi:FPC/CPF motif-containing protein YcgG